MAKKSLFTVLSIGTIIITAQLFFLIGATTGYFPEEWFKKTLIYFVLTIGLFGWGTISTAKFEQKLFKDSFVKSVPKFLLFSGITLVVLLGTKLVLKPEILTDIFGALNLAWYVVIFHAFIVAFDETLVFQVFFPNQFKRKGLPRVWIYLISGFIFALFHFWMVGGQWLLLLPYIPLGFLFLYSRYKWGWISAVGIHFSYNLFILGFI